ncbi:hypothetical protein BDV11DRAFT_192429 [Aspergillus similis]
MRLGSVNILWGQNYFLSTKTLGNSRGLTDQSSIEGSSSFHFHEISLCSTVTRQLCPSFSFVVSVVASQLPTSTCFLNLFRCSICSNLCISLFLIWFLDTAIYLVLSEENSSKQSSSFLHYL